MSCHIEKNQFLIVLCMFLLFFCGCASKQKEFTNSNHFYDHINQLIDSENQIDRFSTYLILSDVIITEKLENKLISKLNANIDNLEKLLIAELLYNNQTLPEYRDAIILNYPEGESVNDLMKLYGSSSYIKEFPSVIELMSDFAVTDSNALKKYFSQIDYADGWYLEIIYEVYSRVLKQHKTLFVDALASEDLNTVKKVLLMMSSDNHLLKNKIKSMGSVEIVELTEIINQIEGMLVGK